MPGGGSTDDIDMLSDALSGVQLFQQDENVPPFCAFSFAANSTDALPPCSVDQSEDFGKLQPAITPFNPLRNVNVPKLLDRGLECSSSSMILSQHHVGNMSLCTVRMNSVHVFGKLLKGYVNMPKLLACVLTGRASACA